MDFGVSELQRELKANARDFMKNECSPGFVRQVMVDEAGMPRALHKKLAELGWTGLIIPERFGGAGLGMLEMALLLEECGYAAMPGPFLFSSAIAASALKNAGSAQLCEQWLPAIARGEAIGTIAIVDRDDSFYDISAAAFKGESGWGLNGTKMFVPYAHVADFIVAAAKPIGGGAVDFFVVERDTKGVSVRPMRGIDQTRRVCEVKFENVQVPEASRLKNPGGLLDRLIDIGAVAMAADSMGGTERALEMAVEYSKVREQFGKPIGSFQALKHAAAEIVTDLEPARALLWYAAYAQDALPAVEASRAAAMAKARLSDVYSQATDRAVLMHGGIGFTWEHDIHIWFKRARFNDSFFGDPTFHRERLAALSDY